MSTATPCTVSIITPAGRGAVATVVIDGAAAAELAGLFFQSASGQSLAALPLNRVAFGTWRRTGSSEEVVVCRTNATQCEIHCHGGRAASSAITADLVSAGAQEISWHEWVRLHAVDMLQAESQWALAIAPTQRCAEILLDQYAGALRRAAENIQTFVRMNDFAAAMHAAETLLAHNASGIHLTTPFRVALLGPPNVGKSSLANRLLGYERSIVFDQPGTTRDVVSATTALDGWPIEFFDTAGVRNSADPLEVAGATRATNTAASADLVLLVDDPETLNQSKDVLENVGLNECSVIRILNKTDLLAAPHEGIAGWLGTSAKSGAGIQQLIQKISTTLVPNPPQPGDAVPFTERQVRLLHELIHALRNDDQRGAGNALQKLQKFIGVRQ